MNGKTNGTVFELDWITLFKQVSLFSCEVGIREVPVFKLQQH